MSEELHKLQKIGAQKIYEQTHIPIQHVQEILQGDFSNFSRVQFLGFISILEREYNEDLSADKAFGMSYFDEIDKHNSGVLLQVPEDRRSKKPFYIASIAFVFILVLILKYSVFTTETKIEEIDNKLIENVEKNIAPKIILDQENNTTDEINATEEVEKSSEISKSEPIAVKSFKILTKSKVWLGYIDLYTNQKKNTIFKGEFDLDPNKNWLLRFGHGYIDMYIDGKIVKFNSRNNLRFVYKDGKLRTINKAEFKKLNRGRSW